MYTNAGIRQYYAPANNRHAVSSSDPPTSWNQSQSQSVQSHHQTRLSDGYVFPSTSTSTPLSTSGTSSTMSRAARTTIYAPPSSFHSYLSSSSSVFSRQYQVHAPSSSSVSSLSTGQTHNYKPSSSLTSLTNSNSHSHHSHSRPSISAADTNAISNSSTNVNGSGNACPPTVKPDVNVSSSSLSRRNGSTCSGPIINVKRLMSKPTAIPPRAHSVLSFSATRYGVPPSDDYTTAEDDEYSITNVTKNDYHAMKSHSLDILKRSKRRSRSVDIMMTSGRKSTPAELQSTSFNTPSQPHVHPTLHGQGPPQTLTLIPQPTTTASSPTYTTSYVPSPLQGTTGPAPSPTSPGTIRPGNQPPAEQNKVDQSHPNPNPHNRQAHNHSRTSMRPNSADVPQSPSPYDTNAGTPRSSFSPVTPASAIALAWTESQKRATTSTATDLRSGAVSPISPSASLQAKSTSRSKSLPAQASPTTYPNVNTLTSNSLSANHSPIDKNPSRVAGRCRSTGIHTNAQMEEDPNQDVADPFVSWVVAERVLSPVADKAPIGIDSSPHGHSGVGVGGVSASVRELSRRLTGAFGRKERSREKHNRPPPSSFSAAELPPIISAHNTMMASASVTRRESVSKAPSPIQMDGIQTYGASNHSTFHQHPSSSQSRLFAGMVKTDGHTSHTLVNHHLSPVSVGQSDVPQSDPIPYSPSIGAIVDSLSDMHFRPSLSIHSKHDGRQEMLAQQVLSPTTSRDTQQQQQHERPIIPRSNTPNTLKKRSKGSLRHKPSTSALVPIGSERAQEQVIADAHVIMGNRMTTTPTLDEDSSTAGKLRGLVKKLSSGALRRSSSQSDKSRSVSTHALAQGALPTVGVAGLNGGHAGSSLGHDVPPVPPLPKDFELIVDAEAYFAERSRRREERMDSDDESAAHSSGLTPQRAFGSSQKSSRRSSPIPPLPHGQSEPILPTTQQKRTSNEPILKPLRRAGTDPIPVDHVLTIHSIPPSTRYVFPRRSKTKPELTSSQGSTSYSASGTDYLGTYRSTSPTHSSSDLHASRSLPIAHDDMESLSSHEMGSSLSHSMIAHPIMAPKELYRHGEDGAATLRYRQQIKEKDSAVLRRKQSTGPTLAVNELPREMDKPFKGPPPKISPTLIVPLGMPPPRPPRREVRGKVSTTSSTEVKPERLRPAHVRHQRSISSPPPLSPASPELPIFSNVSAINAIPLSKRSRSLGGQPRSPRIPPEQPSSILKPSPQPPNTLTRSKSQTSLKSKKGKNVTPLQLTPNSHVSSAQSSPSPRDADDTDATSQRKLRVKTSSGALTRVKSLLGSSKSAIHTPQSHTPTSSVSPSLFSPQSGGRRSTSRRTSRDKTFTEDGEMPPVPFTSTAFAFKEISPMSPKGSKLTEGEREHMWNALLEKSDKAGGTLAVSVDQLDGPSLQSDNASFISAV